MPSPETSLGMLRSSLRPEVKTHADNLWAQIQDALKKYDIQDIEELSGSKADKISTEELNRIQGLVTLFTKVRETGELPDSELTFNLKDATNPYREALLEGGISDTDPRTAERKDLNLNLLDILKADIASYRASNLEAWVKELEGFQMKLSPEKRKIIEQELQDGCIPTFMPGAEVQKNTTPEQYVHNLKPAWIKDGVAQTVQDASMWDHVKELIDNRDPSLTQGVPSRPYILFVKPSQKPEPRTCNKTLDQQKAEAININQERKDNKCAPRGSIKPLEYAALQQRCTEFLKAQRGLQNLSPLDSTTFTRFLDLPIAEASVPSGDFSTGHARVGFGGSSAAAPYGSGGFRSVVRVEVGE